MITVQYYIGTSGEVVQECLRQPCVPRIGEIVYLSEPAYQGGRKVTAVRWYVGDDGTTYAEVDLEA